MSSSSILKGGIALSVLALSLTAGFYFLSGKSFSSNPSEKKGIGSHSGNHKMEKGRRNLGRSEHFFRMLRDPKTNSIPKNIRRSELEFAKNLPTREEVAKRRPDQLTNLLTWKEAGPNDVGGRTRALNVDSRNANIVLAGGVNGGMWRSSDKGSSWSLKTGAGENLSVVAAAQDPVNKDTWYYSMGEFLGSDSDRGFTAFFFGSGLFKSIDNGNTWEYLQFATTKFPIEWDSDFHYTTSIAVSPVNSAVFLGSLGGGVLRSKDGGTSFEPVLGNVIDDHTWAEMDIASTGRIAVALSSGNNEVPETAPGIFVSENNGDLFTRVPITGFPSFVNRTLVRFAPSNPDIMYVMANLGQVAEGVFRDSVLFYKVSRVNNAWTTENRTANLPRFGGETGDLDSQGDYNMLLAVKPNDPNFVVIGFTNLYRSTNGFATKANSKMSHWIGGYTNEDDSFALYPAHHPDQHGFVFDPSNPDKAWSAHDGGLSYTENIGASPVVWTLKNSGYNVTQFYTVAISQTAGNNEFLGGTQDNGSPFFTFNGTTTSASEDISSGDGSYGHIGSRYIYSSSQTGWIDQYDQVNRSWAFQVHPQAANQDNLLFIHPFAVNPFNDAEMVFPDGRGVWFTRGLSATNKQTGWAKTTATGLASAALFSTLAYNTTSTNLIYLGAYVDGAVPRLAIFNSDSKTFTLRNIGDATTGSYPHSIAVNPDNGAQFMVVLSNYKVQSVYYSNDTGASFTGVEGNLAGTEENPGPSVRSATILKRADGVLEYYVGTSVGLYSTLTLNGNNTVWVRESDREIGTAIVEAITSRSSDGKIAAATHGRGIFTGFSGTSTSNADGKVQPDVFALYGNYPNPFNPATTFSFSLAETGPVSLRVFDLNGRKVATVLNELKQAGKHDVRFDASTLSSGVYVYQLSAGGRLFTKKMTLAK